MMPHAAPLPPPSMLTPRAARLASSSLAPRLVGTMRWHAHACHVGLSSATPGQLTRANGVWTNNLRVASMQGRCHCDVTAVPCCTREHASSAAAPSHHLALSLSLHRPALPPRNARL
jgi:hypothetical protein